MLVSRSAELGAGRSSDGSVNFTGDQNSQTGIKTRNVTWNGLQWRSIDEHSIRQQILSNIVRTGYRVSNTGHLSLVHTHVTSDVFSVIKRHARDTPVHGIHVCTVPTGAPVLLVFVRIRNQPWCALVDQRFDGNHAAPNMFLMRHVFTDPVLYDGTIVEGVLHANDTVITLHDISRHRSACVRRLSRDARTKLLVSVHGCWSSVQTSVHLSLAEWKVFHDAKDALNYVVDYKKTDPDVHHALFHCNTCRMLLLLR